MLKSATLLSCMFGMGILLGLVLTNVGRSATAPEEPRLLRSAPAPTARDSALEPQPAPPNSVASVANAPPVLAEALNANTSRLTHQIEAASAARQQLQDELRLLKETAHTLEQRLDEWTRAASVDARQPAPVASPRRNDA